MTKSKKRAGRVLALLLSIMMIVGMLPAGILTVQAEDHSDQVRVIVENTTYTDENAPWTGTLVDKWVDLKEDSTMMSCVVDALGEYSQTGAESNYITEINGLDAYDGGSMSGWMGTINDWFADEGAGSYTVAAGTLSAGDEIRMLYSMNWGVDLGGIWDNADKTLKALSFSAGTLSPAFNGNTYQYTLTIPDNVSSVVVTPTASNKNYQVRTSMAGTEYKRSALIPVTNGAVITIKCGDPAWPSANENSREAKIYYVNLRTNQEQPDPDNKAVTDVMDLIDAIGAVTLDSGNAIAAARKAYDRLTAEQQALVSNYNDLVTAEEVYAKLGQSGVNFEDIYKATGDYLVSLGTPGVGSTGGEWIVIGLARSGRQVPDGYYDAVLQFVKEEINDKEQLHRVKSTENARIILALTALGMDVTNVDGHNLLRGLTDMDYVTKQGINGPVLALIAFDSADYEIPAAPEGTDQVTREKLIEYILSRQLEDGGWALVGSTADSDITGMTIQSLARYCDEEHPKVKAAVEAAVVCLSRIQKADGGFSGGTGNAESCAQVIVALTALGIDPDRDARFIKNGYSALDGLLAFAVDGGGFKHIANSNINGMATEQGYLALVAYHRFVNGKTSLYDMSDADGGTESPQTGDNSNVVLWFTVSLLSLAVMTVLGRKKRMVK